MEHRGMASHEIIYGSIFTLAYRKTTCVITIMIQMSFPRVRDYRCL